MKRVYLIFSLLNVLFSLQSTAKKIYLINIGFSQPKGFDYLKSDVEAVDSLFKYSLKSESIVSFSKYFDDTTVNLRDSISNQFNILKKSIDTSYFVFIIFHGHGGISDSNNFAFMMDNKKKLDLKIICDEIKKDILPNSDCSILFNCCDFRFIKEKLPNRLQNGLSNFALEFTFGELLEANFFNKSALTLTMFSDYVNDKFLVSGYKPISNEKMTYSNSVYEKALDISSTKKLILIGFTWSLENLNRNISYLGSFTNSLSALDMDMTLKNLVTTSKIILNNSPTLNGSNIRCDLKMKIYYNNPTLDAVRKFYSKSIIPMAK